MDTTPASHIKRVGCDISSLGGVIVKPQSQMARARQAVKNRVSMSKPLIASRVLAFFI